MIATTALVSLSGLCGWGVGLTWHARRTAAWRDPGARLAWTLSVAMLNGACALTALVIALDTGWVWLPALVVAALAARGGWWSCQHMSAPDAGERRDRSTGLRWEIPKILSALFTPSRSGRVLITSLVSLRRRCRSPAGESQARAKQSAGTRHSR